MISDALEDPKWKASMIDEMKVLIKNGKWELIDTSRDCAMGGE